MNKKIVSIVAIVAATIVVVAVVILNICKINKSDSQALVNEEETGVKKFELPVHEDVDDEEEEETEDITEDSFYGFRYVENTSGDKYDEFLAGNGTVSFSYYRKNVFGVFAEDEQESFDEDELIGLLPKKDFTLEQLVEGINSAFASSDDELERDYKVKSVSYSFVDCGRDENREMVLEIVTPFWGPSGLYLVVKDIDSQLQVVYAGVGAGRNGFYINEYGGVIRNNNGGGSLPSSKDYYGFIDENGKYKSIYAIQMDFGRYGFAYNSMGLSMDDEVEKLKAEDSRLDGEINVFTLAFDNKKYYTYEVGIHDETTYKWSILDIPNLYTDSEYQKAMSAFSDFEFITMDDLNKHKQERLEELGVTEEMINGKEPEYIELYNNPNAIPNGQE